MDAFNKNTWLEQLDEEEKQFEADLRALVSLLDDPKPGLMTWNAARMKKAEKIFRFLRKNLIC